MLIQEENMQEAIHYLLGNTKQDVNTAFKGHAKMWMRELYDTLLRFQTDMHDYTLNLKRHPKQEKAC